MTTYLLGIDVSTTATKAILVRENGEVAATAASEYPYETPHPQWSEQDPKLWWDGTVQSIRKAIEKAGVKGSQVAAVGLTGQMHGMTLLDKNNEVIRPAILWNDQRTARQCAEITEKVGAQRVLELTGNPVLTGFTAPKILWVRENEPENYRRVAKVLLPKDYVRFRLTGGYFSDVSDSSGTSLFDVGRRCWSEEMLKALEIPTEWMPDVTESPAVSSRIDAQATRLTGLVEGTPVVGGAGDQAASAIGTGIVREGLISATLGTSGVVFAASNTYKVEPEGRLHAFCHAVPGMWHLMGVMLSAAGSFRWYRDALGQPEQAYAGISGKDVYDLLTAEAAQAPAGCEGLVFLPYLTGERTPYPDPDARGVFFGLTVRHSKSHLTRSVLEGVSFGLRDSLELMRALGITSEQVRATGGGARSPFWRQLLADIFNTEIVTVNISEGSAYGAALLAGAGAGIYPDVPAACETAIRITNQVAPGPEKAVYDQVYPLYRSLYPALKAAFKQDAQVVANIR